MLKEGLTIPEMLGMPPAQRDREKPFSVDSYRAQYVLTEEEAVEVRERYSTHTDINESMSRRFANDPEYRKRVLIACQDITATPPSESVKRLMDRMQEKLRKGGKMTDVLKGMP